MDEPYYESSFNNNYTQAPHCFRRLTDSIQGLEPWNKHVQDIKFNPQSKRLKLTPKKVKVGMSERRDAGFRLDRKYYTQRLFSFMVDSPRMAQAYTSHTRRTNQKVTEEGSYSKKLSLNQINLSSKIVINEAKLEQKKFTNTIVNIKNLKKAHQSKQMLRNCISFTKDTQKNSLNLVSQSTPVSNPSYINFNDQFENQNIFSNQASKQDKFQLINPQKKTNKSLTIGIQRISKLKCLHSLRRVSFQSDLSIKKL